MKRFLVKLIVLILLLFIAKSAIVRFIAIQVVDYFKDTTGCNISISSPKISFFPLEGSLRNIVFKAPGEKKDEWLRADNLSIKIKASDIFRAKVSLYDLFIDELKVNSTSENSSFIRLIKAVTRHDDSTKSFWTVNLNNLKINNKKQPLLFHYAGQIIQLDKIFFTLDDFGDSTQPYTGEFLATKTILKTVNKTYNFGRLESKGRFLKEYFALEQAGLYIDSNAANYLELFGRINYNLSDIYNLQGNFEADTDLLQKILDVEIFESKNNANISSEFFITGPYDIPNIFGKGIFEPSKEFQEIFVLEENITIDTNLAFEYQFSDLLLTLTGNNKSKDEVRVVVDIFNQIASGNININTGIFGRTQGYFTIENFEKISAKFSNSNFQLHHFKKWQDYLPSIEAFGKLECDVSGNIFDPKFLLNITGVTHLKKSKNISKDFDIKIAYVDKVLQVDSTWENKKTFIKGDIDFKNSIFNINSEFNDFYIYSLIPDNFLSVNENRYRDFFSKRGSITGSFDYQSTFDEIYNGSGKLLLTRFTGIGDDEHFIDQNSPVKIDIDNKNLNFESVQLNHNGTPLILSGFLNLNTGWQANLSGKFRLEDIIPPIAPIEQFAGDASLNLAISGDIFKPKFSGRVNVNSGILSFHFDNRVLGFRDIALQGDFTDGDLVIENFTARYGSREINANGVISNILDSKRRGYQFNLSFDNLFISPNKNSNMLLDGSLSILKSPSKSYMLKGVIKLLQANYRENIDIVSLLELLRNTLRDNNIVKNDNSQFSFLDDDIDLDLNISANNNVHLETTFLNAEIMGNILVKGSLNAPKFSGEISVVEGVYGSLNTSFNILTGKISFIDAEQYSDANINVLGETQVITAALERSQVRMIIGGTILNPKINFISNTGLTENQLASLIGFDAELNSARSGMEQNSRWLKNNSGQINTLFGDRLNDLLGITDISFGYGPSVVTGEPVSKVTSGRKLTEELSIDISNEFADDDYLNISLNYWLNSMWSLKAGWQNYYVTKEMDQGASSYFTGVLFKTAFPAFGVLWRKDIDAKTVVSAIDFKGNWRINDSTLRRNSSIKIGFPLEDIDFRITDKNLIEQYRRAGFFETKVSHQVKERYVPTQLKIIYTIDEGPRASIKNIKISGYNNEISEITEIINDYIDTRATEHNFGKLRQELLLALRNNGYWMASLWQDNVIYNPENHGVDLYLNLTLGQKIKFEIIGNKYFDKDTLIEPLRLNDRNVPITRNAFVNLATDIVHLYKNYGYYEVEVTLQEATLDDDSAVYILLISEGEKFILSSIEISGNQNISQNELMKILKQKQGTVFNDENWNESIREIQKYYVEKGYCNVIIEQNIYKDLYSNEPSLIAHIKIDEGSCSIIQSVTYNWSDTELENDFNESDIGRNFLQSAIKEGDINDHNNILDEKTKLQIALDELGYVSAKVREKVTEAGDLTYTIISDDIKFVGNIIVKGDGYTKEKIIRREIILKEGERFSKQKLFDSELALYKLGIFSSVSTTVTESKMSANVVDVIFDIRSRDTLSLGIGAGYNTEDGFVVLGEVTEENLNASADTLIFGFETYVYDGQDSFKAGHVNLAHIKRHLFGTDLRQMLRGYWAAVNDYNNSYRYYRYGAELKYDYNINENWVTSFGFNFFEEKVFDVAADLIFDEKDYGWSNYSIFNVDLTFDTRDDIFNTRRGALSNIKFEYAPGNMFGSDGFFGFETKQNFYLPISDRLTWINKLSFQMIEMQKGSVPLTQRMFLGGRNSLRGYKPSSVGPVGYLGDVTGGDTSILYNTELQYDFTKNIMLMTFLDVGSAYLRNQKGFNGDPSSFSDFRLSPGLGLTYRTPIGPLGVTWAKPIGKDFEHNFDGYFILGISSSF